MPMPMKGLGGMIDETLAPTVQLVCCRSLLGVLRQFQLPNHDADDRYYLLLEHTQLIEFSKAKFRKIIQLKSNVIMIK